MLKTRRKLVQFHCILLFTISLLFFTIKPVAYRYFLCSFLKKVSFEDLSYFSFRIWKEKKVFKEQFVEEREKLFSYEKPPLLTQDFFTIYSAKGKGRVASFVRSYEKEGELFHIELFYSLKEWDWMVKNLSWFLFFTLIGLIFLYGGFSWVIVQKITRPLQRILLATRPYREGKMEFLSQIFLSSSEEKDFEPLAETFNSLSEKIQGQIQALFLQHQENQSILESLNEGVISVNEEGRVIYANQIALQFFGQKKERVLFEKLEKLKKGDPSVLLEECEKLYTICHEEKSISSKLITLQKGSKIYVNLVALPKKEGVILVLQDRTADFRVVQMGKEFIANASHEIRTPITVIRGFAETLYEHPELPESTRVEIVKKMVRTSDRLNTILQSLLTLNDVENLTSSHFVECDLKTIIHDCKDLLSSLHKRVQFYIDLPENLFIQGEVGLLQLAFMNILENGIKYSEKPAVIFLKAREEEGVISFFIEDKGIGIPKEDITYIFERFYRVDKARSRKLGGLGLGLSIVKNIVEKHGGTISVYSQENKGTQFRLQFPSSF